MSITIEDVRRTAKLARLDFNEDDLHNLTNEMGAILEYVEKLNELDLNNIPETAHVLQLTNVFREDEVKTGLSNKEALANAPKAKHGHFSVPKVISE
ncbi:MAG: Asp-tRNA(Asn)/Glu-tRNA(Gln) amidotransferase subunit GatC [Deferribacteres bacterium]|nr:Asp-tRNA(Asn)/Glu-tRNA(Gln) amidotransferase subunit GatC [candidate division KSB1 bacterium]MCB9502677.1 Asp-tRNA(Asn)/Glu-tRNA(Gln) amidotransferase subunit GatC [Deferribacteres bacterium]